MRKLMLLMALTAAPAFAAERDVPDDFNILFATACMQYFHSQDKLPDEMDRQGLERLPPEQATSFLSGGEGTAWLKEAPGTRYVVSLSKGSICTVFAQRANPERIQSGFLDLVGAAPPPLVAESPDTAMLGPNNEHARTIARSWSRPKDKEELLFVLTTSSSDTARAQAMASMARVKKVK